MPAIQHGATSITAVQHGATVITSMQHGSTVVWAPNSMTAFDDFERDNGPMGTNWTDINLGAFHKLVVQDGRMRCGIPDGLIGLFWDFTTSTYRWNVATNSADDGYVEVRAATKGDPASLTSFSGYVTDAWLRGNNTGTSHTNGVGLRLRGGQAYIASAIAGVAVERADGGTFQPGDRIRVRSSVNLHTMAVNGIDTAQWNDSGALASKGVGFRSLVVTSQGAKDFLGPRRFGPALDYVMMG